MTRAQWNDKAFRRRYYAQNSERLNARVLERYYETKDEPRFGVFATPIRGYRHNGQWRHL